MQRKLIGQNITEGKYNKRQGLQDVLMFESLHQQGLTRGLEPTIRGTLNTRQLLYYWICPNSRHLKLNISARKFFQKTRYLAVFVMKASYFSFFLNRDYQWFVFTCKRISRYGRKKFYIYSYICWGCNRVSMGIDKGSIHVLVEHHNDLFS